MRTFKSKAPTEAQAKELAALFSQRWAPTFGVTVNEKPAYNKPTTLVLVKKGWVDLGPEKVSSHNKNYTCRSITINTAGIDALNNYLTQIMKPATT